MAEIKSAELDRQLPQAPEIERVVLSSMLLEKEAIGTAIEMISEECFYKPVNAALAHAGALSVC